MHDIRMVRDAADALRDGMRRRGKLDALGPLVERAVALDVERRAAIQAVEQKKAERNAASQEVGKRKKAGQPADDLLAASRALGDEITRLEERLAAAQDELDEILIGLPNVTLPEVPVGDETANAVVRTWGTPREANGVMAHWDVAEKIEIGRAHV